MSDDQACANTDRELWREPGKDGDDFFQPSIHVTAQGSIGMHVGGHIIVMPIRKWHSIAKANLEPMFQCPDCGGDLAVEGHKAECRKPTPTLPDGESAKLPTGSAAEKGYPIPLCGDHIEFEQEHANTPPEKRPDWPLPSFDAQDWAKAFCKINPSMDEGTMLGWFASALMRGHDEHAARSSKETVSLRAELEGLKAELAAERQGPAVPIDGETLFKLSQMYMAQGVELERVKAERGQMAAKLHCMCGSPVDHGPYEGHSPVSVYDHALDQANEELKSLRTELEMEKAARDALQHECEASMQTIATERTHSQRMREALEKIANNDVATDLKGRADILSGIALAALNTEMER